jgi:hypothetical protein
MNGVPGLLVGSRTSSRTGDRTGDSTGSRTGSAPLRAVWLAAGVLCMVIGTVGIVLPLVPTVDCYGLAAYCFARGSRRWEAWLMAHPRIGPLVRDWRATRAVPLRAKWLATVSMSLSCAWAFYALKPAVAWIPAACCTLVALYLWTRPTRPAPTLTEV